MRLRMWNKIRRIFNCLCYVGIALFVLNVIGIPTLIEQLMADPTTLSLFTHDVKKFCGGNFKGYVHKFAILKNVVVVPGRAEGQPGGEEISSVLNQPEYLEYFDFTPGFFTIPCRSIPLYRFRDDHHLNLWMDVLEPESKDVSSDIVRAKGENQVHRRFTIAVTRYEYANLYHQIADFYNAYIMLRVFGLDPDETDILFVDGHPKSALDDIWDTLFGTVIRVGRLDGLTLFENLIWSIQGYTSSLHQHDREKIPEIPEFADFVLKRHDATFTRKPDCMNVSVLFVWRRNYVAHPRNPSGVVARKILNEAELLSYVKKSLTINGKPSGTVKGVHLESLSFAEQLRLARNTDILVGMHGAGLSHTLFLPPHAGLVEIFSKSTLAVNRHFKAMAAWRGLHYRKYQVSFSTVGNENDDTVLEPEEIAEIIDEIKTEICQAL